MPLPQNADPFGLVFQYVSETQHPSLYLINVLFESSERSPFAQCSRTVWPLISHGIMSQININFQYFELSIESMV